MRAGTEYVPGIIGLGVAAEAAAGRIGEVTDKVASLRDHLEAGICRTFPTARVFGQEAPRVANTTNIGFQALEAEAILMLLSEQGICASSGSACSSGSLEPSHVLAAMNADPLWAHGAIRFSLSPFTTVEEVDRVVELLPALLARLEALNPR